MRPQPARETIAGSPSGSRRASGLKGDITYEPNLEDTTSYDHIVGSVADEHCPGAASSGAGSELPRRSAEPRGASRVYAGFRFISARWRVGMGGSRSEPANDHGRPDLGRQRLSRRT